MARTSINQKQLAKSLGLSQQAVSYAIRGTPGVGDATRQRVLEAAMQLGYRPHAGAKAMRRGKFNVVGLLSGTRSSTSLTPLPTLQAIQSRLARADLQLLMAQMPDEQLASSTKLPRLTREWSVDGLIISYCFDYPDGFEQALEATHLPVVWLNAKRPFNAVHPPDFEAARDVTQLVLGHGHRRVAYLMQCNQAYGHFSVADRRSGYEAAMRDAGLEPRIMELPEEATHSGAPFGNPAAQDKFTFAWAKRILARDDRPTAIVSYSSTPGPSLVEAARHLGLSVPGQFAFVGFGSESSRGLIEVATMIVPTWGMGYEAVAMLRQFMTDPHTPQPTRRIPFSLARGDTLGPLDVAGTT